MLPDARFSCFFPAGKAKAAKPVGISIAGPSGKVLFRGEAAYGEEAFFSIIEPSEGTYIISANGQKRKFIWYHGRLANLDKSLEAMRGNVRAGSDSAFWLPALALHVRNIRQGYRLMHQQDQDRTADPAYILAEFTEAEKIASASSSNDFSKLDKPGVSERAFYSTVDDTLCPYTLYLPRRYFASKKPQPLILYLHGSNGTQWELVRTFTYLKQDINTLILPAVVPFGRGNSWYVDAAEKDLVQLLTILAERYRIDTAQLAVSGFSMGGMGTMNLVCDYPRMFAVAAPMAFAFPWEFRESEKVKHRDLPPDLRPRFILMHSPQDSTVDIKYARSVEAALKERNVLCEFITYDKGHEVYPKAIQVFNRLFK